MKTTLFIAVMAASFAIGCGKKDEAKESKTNAGKTAGDGVAANPDKKGPRIAIEVNNKGYKPDKITAKAGDAVLVFTRTDDTHCGKYVKIAGLKGKTELPLNKPVEIGIRLPKSGEVRFACGMDMLKGTLVVSN